MASKQKTRKSDDQNDLNPDILVYIYGLILITFAIIGGMKVGFIGGVVTNFVRFLVGNLYGIVYILMFVIGLLWIFKKDIFNIRTQYLIGIIIILVTWMIAASFPSEDSITGMNILTNFISHSGAIMEGTYSAGGGVIGAFLLSLFTLLFADDGTRLILLMCLIIALIFILSGPLWNMIKMKFDGVKDQFQEYVSRDKQEDDEDEIVEAIPIIEEMPQETNFVDIDLQETPINDGSTFIDVDDIYEGTSNENDNLDDIVVGFDSNIDEKKESPKKKRDKENKRIIEETIGKKDTFESKFTFDYSKYKLPKLSILQEAQKASKSQANIVAAKDSGEKLIQILDEFGVKAKLVGTHIGPSITKFEIKPDLGVRVNKISNLQYDIKMALAAKELRIEAPIPGKSAVGIEIPNREKTKVCMKELMRDIPNTKQDKKLLFALGKDLMGNCIYGELNKMPHLLIAGATGSGKSVCVNSIITSFLLRCKPDEVKLLLIDPKKVEFTPYKEVPHLIGPVITDSIEANRALKVIVAKMEARYEAFAKVGARNIEGYNQYIKAHPNEDLEEFCFIVVIIDELADLMLVAAKEVEASIQRITQLARAAGIHLIVATQRPSVDVITGVIKANIPSRIAFAVSSGVDSRTIIDQMGAEKLLGYGDMLYQPYGENHPTRIQGVFVSDDEVSRVCEFVSKQAKPRYDDAFLRLDVVDQGGQVGIENADPMYEEVKEFVIGAQKASTSLIQRKFSIGYARAARLMDVLEQEGVIGPPKGSKPREVLISGDDTNLFNV